MMRRYSRPRHLQSRLDEAARARASGSQRLDDHALSARRRSAPPTTRSPRLRLAASVGVDDDAGGRRRRSRDPPRRAVGERRGASGGRGRGTSRPPRRAAGTARAVTPVQPVGRPAIPPVGVGERVGVVAAATGCASSELGRRRSRAQRPAPAPRRRPAAPPEPRHRPRRTGAQQLLAPSRYHGKQLGVQQQPVRLQLVPQAGRSTAARTRAEQLLGAVSGRRTADRCACRRRRSRRRRAPNRARAAAPRRGTPATTAREPMCFSSHTTCATPSARYAVERLGRDARADRARVRRRDRAHRRRQVHAANADRRAKRLMTSSAAAAFSSPDRDPAVVRGSR